MAKPPQLSVSICLASEVSDIPALWRDLEGRSDASFFLSWDWIGCWLEQSGAAPYLLAARHEGRIVAMALLQPSRRRRHILLGTNALMLHQVGDPDIDIITIEHNGILVDRAFALPAMQACVDFLIKHRQPGNGWDWDELHLGGVPDPESFRPLADKAGLMMWYHSYKRSWAIDLSEIRSSGGTYLDSLSNNTRYQIRRAIRMYEKRGKLTATPARDVDEAMRYFDEMKELHQRYWLGRGHPGSFAYPFFERFHRALIAACLPKGTVELVCVAVGGVPIGYVYNFVYNGWVCAYHTGFAYETDPKFKPGLVSHQLCIVHHLNDDARLYDFLAGGERYKANLAKPGPDIAYLVLQRPLLRLRAEGAARRLKSGSLSRRFAWMQSATPTEEQPTRGKVLVLGDDSRSFLAVVRSLGRQQIEVHAAPANFASAALRSRYIKRVHYLPYWMDDGAEWLAAMEELLRTERFDLVIPCNETTLLPMQRNRNRLQKLARLAIPDDHAIEVLFDKQNTRELARSLGIPVAPGRLPRSDDTAEGVFAEIGTPVVVKPRKSYSVASLQARGKVQIVNSAAELAAMLPLDPETFLYEGFFPGRGVGVSLVANKGRVLQAFEHHRVRENVSGSYYRVSSELTPALEQACAKIVDALGYTGIGMFEFRLASRLGKAAGDAWVLLEVNARPWGSLPLAVGLGVDFPFRWFNLLVNGTEMPPVTYRTGVFGRNLLPDLRGTLSEARSLHAGPVGLMRLGGRRLLELGRVFTGRELHDVLARDDRRPGWQEIGEVLQDVGSRVTQRLPGADDRARARQSLQTALSAAEGPIRIVVVCQGNICRSPFAAAALRALLPGQNNRVEVSSFGMLPRPGRSTPDFGIAAAAARGIDLQAHRSAHLSRQQAQAATVILVFDDTNRRAVLDRYPDLRAPVLRLGDFAARPLGDIEDPIDGDRAVYDDTYERILQATAGVAELLNAMPALRTPA